MSLAMRGPVTYSRILVSGGALLAGGRKQDQIAWKLQQ
jgi:hypothetical protein